MFYGPDYLVEKDVILVTINYRLNIFGFLSLKDPKLEVPGNAGLKDQTMALNWVKKTLVVLEGIQIILQLLVILICKKM